MPLLPPGVPGRDALAKREKRGRRDTVRVGGEKERERVREGLLVLLLLPDQRFDQLMGPTRGSMMT